MPTGVAPRPAPRLPAERSWCDRRPLPVKWVDPPPRGGSAPGFDFCRAMTRLCADAARRCPELSHIDMSRTLVTFTPSRTRSRYGLQARVTPLRFRDGATVRRYRGVPYRVQRFTVDGRELLYLVTFCLPRFQDQTYFEKLVTVFHELYHIGPNFDGDLRRHPGRYAVHSHSKCEYDAKMGELVRAYLGGPHDAPATEFLRLTAAELRGYYGGVYGVVVPRPKLVPAG